MLKRNENKENIFVQLLKEKIVWDETNRIKRNKEG